MTYEQLADLFRVEQLVESAAEVHGNFCGRIAGGEQVVETEFKPMLSDTIGCEEELIDNVENAMFDLYSDLLRQFGEGAFELQILLPEDAAPLPVRVLALREWCRGFVSGLGVSGLADNGRLNEELTGAIEDLVAIAQADVEADVGEEDERYFMELTEYVRVAVMLLHAELGARGQQPVLH